MLFLETQLDSVMPLQLHTLVFQKMSSTNSPSRVSNVAMPLTLPTYPQVSESKTDYCIYSIHLLENDKPYLDNQVHILNNGKTN